MRTERLALGLTLVNLTLLAAISIGAVNPKQLRAAPRLAPTLEHETQPAAVLRTQRLEIVDAKGRLRSRLNVEPNGEVVFRMTDGSGTIRVKLGADEAGSGLLLLDERTEPGVHIMARRTGTDDRRTTTSLTLRAGPRQQIIRP
jgi:hypothetical protein